MIIILIAAAVIAPSSASPGHDSYTGDRFALKLYSASPRSTGLKGHGRPEKLSVPKVKVRREGKTVEISAVEVVRVI